MSRVGYRWGRLTSWRVCLFGNSGKFSGSAISFLTLKLRIWSRISRHCATSTGNDRRQRCLPLTSLAAIGHFELLRKLYGEIHIAEGVWHELNQGGRRHPGSHEVEKAPWVHRHEVRDQALVMVLQRDLDRCEAETLALAIELKAALVLLDEQEGRHGAIRLGLRPLNPSHG
jgi:hypothetical protein